MAEPEPDAGRYSYEGLDRVLHEKARLGILTALVARTVATAFTELARLCGVTRRSLERYFQTRFRRAPQDSLDQLRQQDLESWLRSERPLKEIAYLTGYKQPSHMTRQFKERHGLCPSEWRVQVAPVLSTDDQTRCVLQITCEGGGAGHARTGAFNAVPPS